LSTYVALNCGGRFERIGVIILEISVTLIFPGKERSAVI
jgi:hypothetical protein